jgi:hypothetical protein
MCLSLAKIHAINLNVTALILHSSLIFTRQFKESSLEKQTLYNPLITESVENFKIQVYEFLSHF